MWLRNIFHDLFGRGPMSKLEAIVVVGYVLGALVLIWCYLDLQRLHRPLWIGDGNRDHWQLGAVVSYLALGWPVFLFAFGWRTSSTRAALVDERARLRPRPTIPS